MATKTAACINTNVVGHLLQDDNDRQGNQTATNNRGLRKSKD